ncbi:dethiobiotin synthase [Halarcobacter bivalviorum]|uniref:ATP-dependent dethiobiotin synthetase BioD n=1 Tax=Halarcobacter bivalviorum TaxID=663364 RepID=A0AAX2A6U1_9BACT|nr:dethiobiotin synthase [Halarcobacter bivalviorum]AXH11510.1 dethiobiotin synthetase [Halarcobacter bivalviorum]RXK09307.1 dethiobiotin synthase [Halarcobacter bivalviorum]
MEKSIFITATNTDVGKTYACEKFINFYAKKGLKVGYFKPVETGVIELPLDGSKMLNLVKKLNPFFDVSIKDVVPYQFELPAAPFVAKKDKKIDLDFLLEKKQELEKKCDILIIEGAGGLMVPIEKEFFIIDLIKLFKAKAKLITPSKLGCINDTLLSIKALEDKEIEFDWYINLFLDKDSFEKVSLPFYKEYFKELKYLHEL